MFSEICHFTKTLATIPIQVKMEEMDFAQTQK